MDDQPQRLTASNDSSPERFVHDLRTPLTVIKGQTQLLQRRARQCADPNNDVTLARLDVINNMVTRLSAVINTQHHADEKDSSSAR
jgi:signal transduction histidine kinase